MVSDSSTSDFTPAVIINCDESTAGIAPTKDHHAPAARRVARSTSSTCSITSTNVSDNGSDAVVAAVVAVDHHDNENPTKKKEMKSSSSSSSSSFRLVRYLSDLPHWQSYNDSQEHFIQQMPKIELHVHLDGSFDPDFLWQYMQYNNPSSMILECLPCQAVLPWDEENKTLPVRQLVQDCLSSQDYHKLCTCRGHRSLKQMLNCFEIFLPLVRRNLDLLEQLAFDFCRRQYQQNVVYTEVRYSPFLLAEGFVVENHDDNNNNQQQQQQQQQQNGDKNYTGAIDGAAVFRAITAGLRRGSYKFNIVVNQILCAITWRPDWAQPTLDLVLEHWHDYPCATVGIDIAAGEEHFDAQNFPHLHDEHYHVFTNKAKSVKYKDIPVTMHAGESPDESSFENVRRAVEEYGASRIGHGYRVVKDAALMQQLRRDKIHLEVCPTSSDETGGWVYDTHPQNGGSSRSSKKKKQWSQHPIVEMLHAGLSFSFSSDDPAVFHTSLAWQYRVAMVKMGFTREEMLRCNLNAIDAAFCSPEEKSKLRRHVLDFAAYSGLEDVNATIASSDDADGETGKWAKNSTSPRGNKHLQQHTERGAWRYTSTSANSSIHRAHHTRAADSALLPSTTATPPQWKRSMSANFVDRVYVYKPSEGGTDNAKEYEYL